jgi:hypothetical protein
MYIHLHNAHANKLCVSNENMQSNPDTAPLKIPPPPLHCAQESLRTEIPYVISKGIP